MMPPFAWLTFAIGSPVMKCLTSSTSSDSYGLPQRRTGIFKGLATGGSRKRREKGCSNRYFGRSVQGCPVIATSERSLHGNEPFWKNASMDRSREKAVQDSNIEPSERRTSSGA